MKLRKTWMWLAALFAVSVVLRTTLANLAMASPMVFIDEQLYRALAQSLADTGHVQFRMEDTMHSYFLYSVVLAISFKARLIEHFYGIIFFINALLMSSAIFPTYLIARFYLRKRSALLVATLSILIPSLFYSSLVMSENLLYPLLLWAVYFMFRTLRSGTWVDVLAMSVLIFLGYITRLEGLILLPLYFVLSGLRFLWEPSKRKQVVVQALVVGLMTGIAMYLWQRSFVDGSYAQIKHGELLAGPFIRAFFSNLSMALIACLLVPGAFAMVEAYHRGRSQRFEDRYLAFTAVGTLLAATFLSAYLETSTNDFRLHERYLFYCFPLILLLAVAYQQRKERNVWAGAGAVAISLLLLLTMPKYLLVGKSINAETPSLLVLKNLLKDPTLIVLALSASALLLLATALSKRFQNWLWPIVTVTFLLMTAGNYAGLYMNSAKQEPLIRESKEIASAVKRTDRVLLITPGIPDFKRYFMVQFWMPTSEVTIAYTGHQEPDGWRNKPLTVDAQGRLTGELTRVKYDKVLVMDPALRLQGKVAAQSVNMVLYDVKGQVIEVKLDK
ncbi:MAG: glycosyltransferase family 39 protein [Tumebacillaceae bacterium]